MSESCEMSMSDCETPPRKKCGRKAGVISKRLEFTRYYAIKFHYRGNLYIYCYPKGANNPTFIPLELVKHQDLEDLHILKYKNRFEAEDAMREIDYFDMNGVDVDLEIVCNDDSYFYELAEPVYIPPDVIDTVDESDEDELIDNDEFNALVADRVAANVVVDPPPSISSYEAAYTSMEESIRDIARTIHSLDPKYPAQPKYERHQGRKERERNAKRELGR